MEKIIRTDLFSNTYIIDRFNVCYIVDPSADYDDIIKLTGGKEILGILLTHAHFDHTYLINQFSCPIYIHKEDAYLLFEDDLNGFKEYGIKRPFLRKDLDIRFLFDKMELDLADQKITVFHTPGHTAGSVSFLYNDKLFTGDTLFKQSIGRTTFYSGNNRDMKKSVLFLMDNFPNNTKVYPGHGEMTSIKEEKKLNPYYHKFLTK